MRDLNASEFVVLYSFSIKIYTPIKVLIDQNFDYVVKINILLNMIFITFDTLKKPINDEPSISK